MRFNFQAATAILAFSATIAHATTFHNKDTAYTINVAKKDGSTTYVGPSSSIEINDGWAYIRVCQQQKAGDYFVCRPGEVTWPEWYGEVWWYLSGLTEGSAMSLPVLACPFLCGCLVWRLYLGDYILDPNDCPAGFQDLPGA
ncbi:hypothetical protein BDW59DRAFT_161471 [Aspergillus cavernicola]|uniref:Uncharacterized protein n=1 Tax=Aspergillus cavernicola TaxID=176166 RepID=A0ABR4IDJ0_9EURO